MCRQGRPAQDTTHIRNLLIAGRRLLAAHDGLGHVLQKGDAPVQRSMHMLGGATRGAGGACALATSSRIWRRSLICAAAGTLGRTPHRIELFLLAQAVGGEEIHDVEDLCVAAGGAGAGDNNRRGKGWAAGRLGEHVNPSAAAVAASPNTHLLSPGSSGSVSLPGEASRTHSPPLPCPPPSPSGSPA